MRASLEFLLGLFERDLDTERFTVPPAFVDHLLRNVVMMNIDGAHK